MLSSHREKVGKVLEKQNRKASQPASQLVEPARKQKFHVTDLRLSGMNRAARMYFLLSV